MNNTGLGTTNAIFNVYVERTPPLEYPLEPGEMRPVVNGEINAINQAGGNGWRKVFNVYAKLVDALPAPLKPASGNYQTWQSFRDQELLQAQGKTALCFGDADIVSNAATGGIHIVAGRTHAGKQGLSGQCRWLSESFAVHPTLPIFICPYFDYRQLSNAKIDVLVNLISQHSAKI